VADDNNDKTIDVVTNFNPDNHMKTESQLIYHVYNNSKIKSFQNYHPLFCKFDNVSAMKMKKIATNVGGIVFRYFTDTIIF
jgi:hypothetical protein